MMPIYRTTIVLAALCAVGLGHVLLFEPRLATSDERQTAQRRVVQLVASEVQRIKVRRDPWTSALVERSDKHGFRLVEPAAAAVRASRVLELLSLLEFLQQRASLGSAQQAARPSAYGLDPPQLEISIATYQGRELHLAVGQRSAAGDGVYLKVLGQDPILVVDERLARAANALLDAAIGDADKALEGARDDAGAPPPDLAPEAAAGRAAGAADGGERR